MKIQHIHSYKRNNKAGVSGQIVFNNGKTYDLFFEVEEEFSNVIATDATSFLAAMLPIGMLTKEDIEVDGSVSKKFMIQTPAILNIVTAWDKGFYPISIHTNKTKPDKVKGKRRGCFFSGGADSYYTYLKNQKKINTLIFVHGFDIKVKDTELYSMVEKNITSIADAQKVKLLKVKTNIREIYEDFFDWDLAHGFAVGSVALFVRNGFSSIYVSCGLPTKNMDHSSMTPELDPLWSGEHARVIHYGCDADKLLKLKELAKFPIVMKTLRVCWVNKNNAYNCCSCEKCYRNMLGLYVYGGLKKCETFDKPIDLEKFKNTIVSPYVVKYFKAILEALDEKGDTSEIRLAVEEFVHNNTSPTVKQKFVRDARMMVRTIDQKYNHNRLYWFMASRGFV